MEHGGGQRCIDVGGLEDVDEVLRRARAAGVTLHAWPGLPETPFPIALYLEEHEGWDDALAAYAEVERRVRKRVERGSLTLSVSASGTATLRAPQVDAAADRVEHERIDRQSPRHVDSSLGHVFPVI